MARTISLNNPLKPLIAAASATMGENTFHPLDSLYHCEFFTDFHKCPDLPVHGGA